MLRQLFALIILTYSSLIFAFGISSPFGSSSPEFLPVDQAFILSIDREDNGQVIAHWDIAEGYYLYKHQLKIEQESGPALSFGDIPSGTVKEDPYFGTVEVFHDQLEIPLNAAGLSAATQIAFSIGYQGCAERGLCYPPELTPMSAEFAPLNTLAQGQAPKTTPKVALSGAQKVIQLMSEASVIKTISIMVGLGLLLSFTPCVLPMVPIVSAIVVGSKARGWTGLGLSFIYVLGMAITYALIGALAGWFGTQLNLQAALQNPVVLMTSAALFAVLALAMFGAFELRLPSVLQDKLNHVSGQTQQSRSRLFGIFCTGMVATLVVSPCVSAPLAGVVLYISSNSDPLYGALALFAMGLGMGIPLLVVGALGSTVLPKNGPWLEDIKKLMGFGMLAMAIWLATRWLPLSTHLALWGLLSLSIAAYFLHRAMSGNSHPVRWFVGLLTLIIAMVELVGAILGETNPTKPLGAVRQLSEVGTKTATQVPYYAKVTSLDEFKAVLEQSNKPVVADLYADWCISCKVTEEEIFKAADILPLLEQVAFVQVDVTDNTEDSKAFLQAFNLYGPPSMLFFDETQQSIESLKLIGEPTKQEVSERLQAILSL